MTKVLPNKHLSEEPSEKRKILIFSSIVEDWGGSEELWAQIIPILQQDGYLIHFMKNKINFDHPKFISLANIGVILEEIAPKTKKKNPILKKVSIIYRKITRKIFNEENFVWPFTEMVIKIKPDLVLISQGINFDGLGNAYQCAINHIPYVVLSQKAVDFYWPEFFNRPHMIHALQNAKKCFFVSQHNLTLTEEQFGIRLHNAKVVYNPVRISNGTIKYPAISNGYNLACIGRLFVLDKGQDILIRILALQKWKDRPIKVSFIGTGGDAEGLQAMAKLLNVKNVEFVGHVNDIENLWHSYHALLLPSRSEGLPLAMIEAMAACRPVIVSNAGGNAEVITDGENGFIGLADVVSFDEAMERAWERKADWEVIGLNAANYVKENIPKHPEQNFATQLCQIIN